MAKSNASQPPQPANPSKSIRPNQLASHLGVADQKGVYEGQRQPGTSNFLPPPSLLISDGVLHTTVCMAQGLSPSVMTHKNTPRVPHAWTSTEQRPTNDCRPSSTTLR